MRIDRRLAALLLLYGLLLLLPAGRLNLIETTEARYGEIAREMLASGNLLEPTFNGIYHFHKPPLPYWAMAGGMALFGPGDFGVRFFGVVAALAALLFLHRTALLLFGDRDRALAAAAVLASSLLFVAISRVVSTDIYLACCVLGAQHFLFRQAWGERSRGNAAAYGLLLGLGFMVKGPIVFLFTLLPQLAAKAVDPRHRRLFRPGEILLGLACFLAVALPWYVAVVLRHPGLLYYFTKTQTVDRVATDRFIRYQPFWYFLYIFPATFLPWTVPLLRGGWRYRECPPPVRALFVYVLAPLLVFSVSVSKLPPYILPFYGTAALLAVHAWRELSSPWDDRVALATALLLAVAIGAAGFLSPPLRPVRLPLAGAGVAALAAWLSLRRLAGTERFLPAAAAFLVAVFFAAYMAFPWQQAVMKGYRPMAERMNGLDPERKVTTLVYRAQVPSISFYRGELAVMAMGPKRETQFQGDEGYRRWYVQGEEELRERVAGLPRLFLVAEPRHLDEFSRLTSFACTEILAQKRFTAYDCRPAPPPPEGAERPPPPPSAPEE